MRRVVVENISDGGLLYWLVRFYGLAIAALVFTGLFSLLSLYIYFARELPVLPNLATYAADAPGVTTVRAQDGSLLAEFATQRREIVPFSRIPQPLIDAFLATEDRRFFSHTGLDVRGLSRALWANFRAGQAVQGGSTITQQVSKAFLSSEKSLTRKLKEAIFARRLEARYSKKEILSLYLNHIFLGNGAYGVQAAAQRYFDRDVDELNLGQMAMIAGLARAPSRYSPFVDLDAAMGRRREVLQNLVEIKALSQAEADEWKTQPLDVRARRDFFREVSPYFSEHVRREIAKKRGTRALYEGGLQIETTLLPTVDLAAQDNVDAAARRLDKRQGWRGPEMRLDRGQQARFIERSLALYGNLPLDDERLYLGLVEKVQSDRATVRVGAESYPLPIANMTWAAPFSAADSTNDKLIDSVTQALKVGDVIWVRTAWKKNVRRFTEFAYDEKGEPQWIPERLNVPRPAVLELLLEQTPRVQGAIYAFDHHDGYVVAMAGGDDFDRSEFNRVTQACRQPGSAYKPVYYSLALDRGYSYDTLWNDKPKAEVDPITGEQWIPQNVDGTYSVQATLERALVWSKNPPSVEVFRIVGSKNVSDWAKRLGIASPLITSPKCETEFCSSLALGASCVHLDEITAAFGTFARNGKPVSAVGIRRVLDRKGEVLEDNTAWDDAWLDGASRLDRIAAKGGSEPKPVIEPRTAYLTTKLLREIVSQGHSAPIRATKIPAAGKTGTSSRTSDVWFIGFTSRWMATAWVGDDTYQRQLGYKDASFTVSVPMWARFMAQATQGQPLEEIPWEIPAGVKPNDKGGPLKKGFDPPPPLGIGVDGKPIALPQKLQEMIRP